MPREHAFLEIAAILSLATVLGIIGQRLRQPLIIMFLVTGILAGPSGFGFIESYEQFELLAHMGIALLLFIVGLKLDVHLIRTIGPVALATGIGQIIFTAAIGFLISLALGISLVAAIYMSMALTFSSTIIVVKLLSDKKEIDSLHGQIAIGVLIIQDIAVILALVVLTTFGARSALGGSALWTSVLIAVKGVGLLGAVGLVMRYVLPGLTHRLAQSQESLALFAIAWAVCLAAASEMLGFSKEVGAFIAGVSLASTRYRDAIGTRLSSLRDFLLLFFFIDLGARLEWSTVGSHIGAAALLSLFVLVGKPFIVLATIGFMGYRRRTGFLTGSTLAQISEFSLIVAALGVSIGHITEETMGLVTLVGVVTVLVSTYLILYSGPLYNLLSGPLKMFERRRPYRESDIGSLEEAPPVDVVLFGLGNYGSNLAEYLLRRNKTIVGVDFDPAALERWRSRGMTVVYGDMADPGLHEHLSLSKARWVVSTVRSRELSLALVRCLKNSGFEGKVALTAANREEARLFEKAGVRVVFRPFADAAEQAADALTHAMDLLPEDVNWPIAVREVRIRSESAAAGQTIRNIPIGPMMGIAILAVSRAGRVHYDLGPDFQIYPGDRLVIIGPPEELWQAEKVLNQFENAANEESPDRFDIAEVCVGEESSLAGRSLEELEFRRKYRVTVVGIRRGEEQITTVYPAQRVAPGDCLIVVGTMPAVEELKKAEPL